MAAPEAQFQQAGINTNTYTPVKGGDLGGSHLFGGAGQLWAQVGKTALDAASQFNQTAQMIQQSPLNPAVKAQMNYNVDQYKAAQDHIDYIKSLGALGQVVQKTGQGGLETVPIASIQDPTLAARMTANMGLTPKPGGSGSGPSAPINNPSQQQASPQDQGQSDIQQHPENYFLNPATGSYERRADAPPIQTPQQGQPQQKRPPTAGDMGKTTSAAPAAPASMDKIGLVPSQGGSTAASTAGGDGILNTGQPQSPDIIATPAQKPSGSIWSPMRPTPMAPPAPDGSQPAQPPAQGQSPAAATKADQASMQQWQNQNAHPVMSSQDALAWMKTQTTLAQDATYLPMGGPGGSPAFAFHIKGGGINTVPVSQMVAKGAGPLVAAQNTSQVISKTDQQGGDQGSGAQGQPPAPQTPPPGLTPPNLSPPPPANLPQMQPTGQVSGAPAAPTGPAPGPQYPNISGPPPAPIPGAYNPTPYRDAVAQATANPQNLMAQTAPAGQPAQPAQPPGTPLNPPPSATTVSQADQDTLNAQAKAMGPPTGEYLGDRPLPGNTGPYTYYVNDDPNSTNRGRVYTTLPGPPGHYFDQKRWYLGTNQYEDYELPDSAARQQMWDKWGQNGFLSRDEISKMPEKEMEPWLQRAWQNENFARSSPTTGFNSDLDASEQFHTLVKQAHDIIQTLGENGYPNLSSLDKLRAAGANAANTLVSKQPFLQESPIEHALYPAGEMLRGLVGGMDTTSSDAIRALDQTIDKTQKLVQAHPELLLNPGEGGGQETPNIHIADWVRLGLQNIPASNILSDAAWSGQDLETRLRKLDALQAVGDTRYKSLVSQGQTQWMRIDPKHDANVLRIDQGKDLNDPGNLYKDHIFTVDSSDYRAFADKHPNTRFKTTDGQTLRTPP